MGKDKRHRGIVEQQEKNRSLRRAYAEIATQTGAIDQIVKLLSAGYLLHSHSAVLFALIEEILIEHRLSGGKLVSLAKNLNKSFDDYFNEFSKMIGQDQVNNWANDLEMFGEMFGKYAGLQKDFVTDFSKVDLESINKKFNTKIEIKK